MVFLNMLPEGELAEVIEDEKNKRGIRETIMGRAIDLFVTYRFIRLLTTPFEKVMITSWVSLTKMVIVQI